MKNTKKKLITKTLDYKELAYDLVRSLSGRELKMLMKNPQFKELLKKFVLAGAADVD